MTTELNTPTLSLVRYDGGTIVFEREGLPGIWVIECTVCDEHITSTENHSLATRLAEHHVCQT